MSTTGPRPELTNGKKVILAAATIPMIAVGIAGGVGTFNNISGKYGSGTAVGALAAGEGATAVAALLLLVTTMLGQSAPAIIRIALWALPAAAAVMGATAANGTGEAIVYSLTPMAITAAAEGVAFLSRRVVVHRTGVDMEVQRRNAETVQRLAYHRARAANHPKERARRRSERASWRLAKRVGVGDTELGAQLVEVQRDRLTEGADAALLDMFTVASAPAPAAVEVIVERADEKGYASVPTLGGELTAGQDHFVDVPKMVGPEGYSPVSTPAPDQAFPVTTEEGVELVPTPGGDDPEPATRQTYQLDHLARRWVPSEQAAPWGDVPSVYDRRVPDWTVGNEYWKGDPVIDPKPVNVTTQAAPQEPRPTVTEPEPEHHAPVTETVTQQAAAVPAKESRQVVTEAIGLNPTELRRQARQLHNKVVKSGGRGVTIDQLRDEFGLSRREATELRRTVVSGDQS
ncbi:hypothetical protein [Streptomyces sp. 061-3]|uniref:hypothetical protein n=1 Tax=Streptomyces sp. 061-3 TaxID=2789268 RepID=UPI003980668D